MIKENHDSVFMKNIQKVIEKGIITVTSDGSRITYHCKEIIQLLSRIQKKR